MSGRKVDGRPRSETWMRAGVGARRLFPLAVFRKSRTALLASRFLKSEAVQALEPCREHTMEQASLVLDARQAALHALTQPLELKT